MKYSFLLIVFAIWFFPEDIHSQVQSPPHLTIEMVNENGLLVFSGSEEWKYHPGDNLDWAQPEYDDSNWLNISPEGLQISEIPDSLWQGYGWWRLSFNADSAFYSRPWNLFLTTWGAAEVYLDGELVHSAGNFAVYEQDEILNSALNQTYPPIKLENKSHILAIRYSNHKAKSIENTFSGFDNYLGFNIGFSNQLYNENIINEYDNRQFIAVFSIAVLLVLIILHSTLYLKFSEDKSNLFVAVFLIICLITVFFNFDTTFYEPTLLQYNIANSMVVLCASIAIFMMPYLIASILRLDGYSRTKHLIWAAPFITLLHIKSGSIADFVQIGISVFSIGLTIKILFEGKRKNKFGLTYIAFGGILPLIAICIYYIEKLGFISIHQPFLNMLGIVIFTIFPFALTLYIADRYGYLYSSLEKEVKERTNELEVAYSNLKKSLEDLKATQHQLVQQEKLASLGQLTAGIAHEIKNPLNFVNNFSELSVELIEEAREELSSEKSKVKGEKEKSPLEGGGDSSTDESPGDVSHVDEALEILNDIETNLRKIHEHGNRADSIVKSMLQHSRGGSGKMEPTDLNGLVKEYVNLTFHGMRASKDPINVDIEMNLDEKVGEVPLVAEDFSRVIVNLCNNAFDAMREKLNSNDQAPNSKGYKPVLTVRTSSNDEKVVLEIEDNGPGIPEDIKDKVLQPFFTTKKGTEGTGLGLSITNDVIKAHGGLLEIESGKNGATFKISL